MAKLRRVRDGAGNPIGYAAFCPGCNHRHVFYTEVKNANRADWRFNGMMDRPTFLPSMKVTLHNHDGSVQRLCHSFLRNGTWQYLSDCTHHLAGKTVPVPDYFDDDEA